MKPAPGCPQAAPGQAMPGQAMPGQAGLGQAKLGQAKLVMAALCALPLPSGDRRAILAPGPIRKSGDTKSS
jgi:hypothetical protein